MRGEIGLIVLDSAKKIADESPVIKEILGF